MPRFYWAQTHDKASDADTDTAQPRSNRTVERISVEPIIWTADHDQLEAELCKCGLRKPRRRRQILWRLVDLPPPLLEPMERRRGLHGAPTPELEEMARPDSDTLAQMLGLGDCLSRKDRRRVKKWGDYWIRGDGGAVLLKGRPPKFDYAIVLYLVLTLMEALKLRKFTFSRSPPRGKPGGPKLRALMRALEILRQTEMRTEDSLRIGIEPMPKVARPEGLVRLVAVINSQRFKTLANEYRLPLKWAAIANQPASYRHLVAIARRPSQRVTD